MAATPFLYWRKQTITTSVFRLNYPKPLTCHGNNSGSFPIDFSNCLFTAHSCWSSSSNHTSRCLSNASCSPTLSCLLLTSEPSSIVWIAFAACSGSAAICKQKAPTLSAIWLSSLYVKRICFLIFSSRSEFPLNLLPPICLIHSPILPNSYSTPTVLQSIPQRYYCFTSGKTSANPALAIRWPLLPGEPSCPFSQASL